MSSCTLISSSALSCAHTDPEIDMKRRLIPNRNEKHMISIVFCDFFICASPTTVIQGFPSAIQGSLQPSSSIAASVHGPSAKSLRQRMHGLPRNRCGFQMGYYDPQAPAAWRVYCGYPPYHRPSQPRKSTDRYRLSRAPPDKDPQVCIDPLPLAK